jgi:RNA polymerase-binding transcription factor DksA
MPTKKSKSKPQAKASKPAKPVSKKTVVSKKTAPVKKAAKAPAKSAKASKPAKTPVKTVVKAVVKAAPKAPASFVPVKVAPVKFGAKKLSAPAPVKASKSEARPVEGDITTLNPKKKTEFLDQQKQRLLELRDHILDQMQGVAQDSLRSRAEGSEGSAFGMHQADAGSDAYEKDFALSLLSQEQDALYEIEEALKRIEGGTYGICEMSNEPIPRVRLEAIPFARFTVDCQTQFERENRGRRRWETSPQFMDSSDNASEEDEGEGLEDEDRKKEKE